MPWPVHPNGLLGAQGDNDSYQISRSLRFNDVDSAYLNRTPASASNRKTWTWSGWVKKGTLGGNNVFMGNTDASGYNGLYFQFDTNNNITIGDYGVGSYVWVLTTSQVFRDTSSWYHIVATFDSTQATASDRVSVYINGTKITAFSTATYPSLNLDGRINSTQLTSIGRLGSYNGFYFDGYLAEINFIDGQALTPSSFGETDSITGRWKAKAYSGSYGTNGFYLKFADNSGVTAATIGKDSSGNSNNWTPNNFSVTAGVGNDSLVDSPTNYGSDAGVGGEVRGNYCTLNPLDNGGLTLANGNLDASRATASWASVRSSVGMSSGKWYWEITPTSGISVGSTTNQIMIGISKQSATLGGFYQSAEGWGYYYNDGNKWNNNSGSSYGATFTNNDVIGVAFDADNGTLVFYKNNASQGTAFSGLTNGSYFPTHGLFGTASSVANFGQRPFAYTAPTGFKALCTTNLPTPTIKKPSSYMDVVTYTGTGATQSITSLGFSPDLLWTKGRSLAQSNNLFDTLRSGQRLRSDTTGADVATTVTLGSSGFTLGAESENNNSGSTFVAWAWDESPIAGLDIVGYTGNGSNMTISHSLGVTPKMIINKLRSGTGGWPVYHASLGNTGAVQLEATGAFNVSSAYWVNTSPTSSNFTVGSGLAVNGATYINYVFAEIEGFSKFGSYTGNGSADGSFVWCGFRPRWILIKATVEASNWLQWDTSRMTFNAMSTYLMPSSANAEATDATYSVDCTSSGFKIRGTGQFGGFNNSGNAYIFAAFAESPFKYARAR